MSSDWLAANELFTVTAGADPFGDLGAAGLWNWGRTDLTVGRFPPLFALRDLMAIVQHHRGCPLKRSWPHAADLVQRYRAAFVFPLMYEDDSVAELHRILLTKGRRERPGFLPLLVRTVWRELLARTGNGAVAGRLAVGSGAEPVSLSEAILTAEGLLTNLLAAPAPATDFFPREQLDLFAYVRREADIPLVREYGRARKLLDEIDPRAARMVRAAHSVQIEVVDRRAPAMGGICGIASGGSIEKLESILPSELAMMDPEVVIDLFDVNVLENSLLSFQRDRSIDTRRHRTFHLVFFSPEAMGYRPQHIDFRWQYFFLAVVFQIIAFYRAYFNLRRFPFHFVFPERPDQSHDVGELIDIVQRRDFPDITVETHRLTTGEMNRYLDGVLRHVHADQQSIGCFSKLGTAVDFAVPPEIDLTNVRYGGAGRDEIRMMYACRQVRREFLVGVGHAGELPGAINQVRDLLFKGISGAVT